MSGLGAVLVLRPVGKRISKVLAWLLRHPLHAALIAAAVWLGWLHLVTLPDLNGIIAQAERTILTRTAERDEEARAHRATKRDYATAQLVARQLEEKRLARVAAEQQEITDEVAEDYRRRVADARAAAERLRSEALRAGERPARAAGDLCLPGTGGAAGGAAEAASDRRLPLAADELEWRLTATEQALQLEALIAWVQRQAVVNNNEGQ